MIVYTDPQGSQAWLDSRKGVITASRFKDCRAKLKNGAPDKKCVGYAQDTARQRVGGTVPEVYVNAAMRFGSEQEPLARMAYEQRTGYLVEEVGFMTTDDRMFGVSLDGTVDEDGFIEIKTMVSSDTLFTALGGDISAYTCQVLGGFWLTGRKWCDLVLWAPDLKEIGAHLTIIRIERDEEAIQALEDDLMKFAAMVADYEALLRRVALPAAPAAEPEPTAAPAAPDWRTEFLTA